MVNIMRDRGVWLNERTSALYTGWRNWNVVTTINFKNSLNFQFKKPVEFNKIDNSSSSDKYFMSHAESLNAPEDITGNAFQITVMAPYIDDGVTNGGGRDNWSFEIDSFKLDYKLEENIVFARSVIQYINIIKEFLQEPYYYDLLRGHTNKPLKIPTELFHYPEYSLMNSVLEKYKMEKACFCKEIGFVECDNLLKLDLTNY